MTRGQRDEIPQGTLDMLILRTLDPDRELHGFEIAESIRETSEDVLQVEEGSLYPALQRMLVRGWIVGEWGRPTRTGAPAITGSPRAAADNSLRNWNAMAGFRAPSRASSSPHRRYAC